MNTKLKSFLMTYKRWLVVGACSLAFLILAILVKTNAITNADMAVLHFFVDMRSKPFTIVQKIITFLASEVFMVGMCLIILIVVKDKRKAIKIVLCVAFSAVLNYLLKDIMKRPRPVDFMIVDEKGYSFPSGHAMASMTFYAMLIYLMMKSKNKKSIKITFSCICGALIFFIGASRLYLGAHFLSDVLAGYLMSVVFLLVYEYVLERFFMSEEEKEELAKREQEKNKAKSLGFFVLEFPTAEQKAFMDEFYEKEAQKDEESFEDYKILDDKETREDFLKNEESERENRDLPNATDEIKIDKDSK